jgi:putative oxidoreductase
VRLGRKHSRGPGAYNLGMGKSSFTTWEPLARSILRIVAGFLFSLHGFQKLFGAFGGMGGRGAKAEFFSLVWAAGFLETVGGLMILIGLATRPTAFVLSGQMAVAYFMTHASRGFWPILNGGELAALYCFLFLWFAAAGAGPWSVDRLLGRKT